MQPTIAVCRCAAEYPTSTGSIRSQQGIRRDQPTAVGTGRRSLISVCELSAATGSGTLAVALPADLLAFTQTARVVHHSANPAATITVFALACPVAHLALGHCKSSVIRRVIETSSGSRYRPWPLNAAGTRSPESYPSYPIRPKAQSGDELGRTDATVVRCIAVCQLRRE